MFITSLLMTGFAQLGRIAVSGWCNEAESSLPLAGLGLAPSLSQRYRLRSLRPLDQNRNVSRALLPPHADAQLIDE